MPPKKKAVNSESKTVKKSSKKDLVMDEENTNITDTFKRVKKATGKGGTLKKKIRKDIADIDVQSIQAILKSFDLNCDYRKFGADLISHKGKLIDVKCASKIGGNLNAVGWSGTKPVDVFVLTELHSTCVRVIGWIPRKEFLVDENRIDIGNGEYYSVKQSELIPFESYK